MRPLEIRRGQERTASTKCHSYFILKVSLTCGQWSVEPLYSEHFSPHRGSGCRGSTSPDAVLGILVCWASVAEDVQRADKLLALPRRAAPSVHGDGHGCWGSEISIWVPRTPDATRRGPGGLGPGSQAGSRPPTVRRPAPGCASPPPPTATSSSLETESQRAR